MTEAKRVLITGANKGIGFGAARALGREGLKILVGSRDPDRGEKAVKDLIAEGIDARLVIIDVSDQNSVTQAADQVSQDFGQLDILINNAGIGLIGTPPSALDVGVLRDVLDTNLIGALITTQAFLPLLKNSDFGRIVNVSSIMGSISKLSDPNFTSHKMAIFTPYSISKAALNMFTALLAVELQDTDIKVNAVEPGYTDTEMTNDHRAQSVEDAVRVIVKYALIGNDGPTGGYFDVNGAIPW